MARPAKSKLFSYSLKAELEDAKRKAPEAFDTYLLSFLLADSSGWFRKADLISAVKEIQTGRLKVGWRVLDDGDVQVWSSGTRR